jgi:hypothetical protein
MVKVVSYLADLMGLPVTSKFSQGNLNLRNPVYVRFYRMAKELQ